MNRIFLKENATLAEVIEAAKANNAKFIIITRDHYRGNACGEIYSVENLTGIDIDFRWFEFEEDRGIQAIAVTTDDCLALREWQKNMKRKSDKLMEKYNDLKYVEKCKDKKVFDSIEEEVASIWKEIKEKVGFDLSKFRFVNL